MARHRIKTTKIELLIEDDQKQAFEAWCDQNNTTMSDAIRKKISRCISEGKKILAAQEGQKTA
jgi:antitoxin component of RelBE/YafQ-DinJ toxin-antitoxin module